MQTPKENRTANELGTKSFWTWDQVSLSTRASKALANAAQYFQGQK